MIENPALDYDYNELVQLFQNVLLISLIGLHTFENVGNLN
jgi:hypothetical protein